MTLLYSAVTEVIAPLIVMQHPTFLLSQFGKCFKWICGIGDEIVERFWQHEAASACEITELSVQIGLK